jgi:GAF domain-containing protein
MTDSESITDAGVDELHRALGFLGCAVLHRRDDNRIAVAAARGPLADSSDVRPLEIVDRCVRERRSIVIDDLRVAGGAPAQGPRAQVRSQLAVPITVGERLWGALIVEDIRPAAFDEDDVRMAHTIADQIGLALRSALLYQELDRAYLGTAEALATALEAKDSYTWEHARSIVENANAVGRRLGMSEGELRDLRYGAVLHDIGKIAVPEPILNKRGPLEDDEADVIRRHTLVGEQILRPIEFLSRVRLLVRHEHERWDGQGYPDGLAGEEIPLGSRVILACDAYDAMTSDRPYRSAMSDGEARAELRRFAGTQFDPTVVDTLMDVLDERERNGGGATDRAARGGRPRMLDRD